MKEENRKLLETLFDQEKLKSALQDEIDNPEIVQLLEEFAIEKVWARKGLSLRERSIITIASQAAMGRWDQVENHVQSFIHMGGRKTELKEIFIHLSVYCGFPTMLSGMRILKAINEG